MRTLGASVVVSSQQHHQNSLRGSLVVVMGTCRVCQQSACDTVVSCGGVDLAERARTSRDWIWPSRSSVPGIVYGARWGGKVISEGWVDAEFGNLGSAG